MTKKSELTPEEIKNLEKLFSRLSDIAEKTEDKINTERDGDIFTFSKHIPDAGKIVSMCEDSMTEISPIFYEIKKTIYVD